MPTRLAEELPAEPRRSSVASAWPAVLAGHAFGRPTTMRLFLAREGNVTLDRNRMSREQLGDGRTRFGPHGRLCVNRRDSKARGTSRSRSGDNSNFLKLFNFLKFGARVQSDTPVSDSLTLCEPVGAGVVSGDPRAETGNPRPRVPRNRKQNNFIFLRLTLDI